MDSEMDSLVKNQTWTLVNKPPKDKKVLDVKWVYKRKSENEVIVEIKNKLTERFR